MRKRFCQRCGSKILPARYPPLRWVLATNFQNLISDASQASTSERENFVLAKTVFKNNNDRIPPLQTASQPILKSRKKPIAECGTFEIPVFSSMLNDLGRFTSEPTRWQTARYPSQANLAASACKFPALRALASTTKGRLRVGLLDAKKAAGTVSGAIHPSASAPQAKCKVLTQKTKDFACAQGNFACALANFFFKREIW